MWAIPYSLNHVPSHKQSQVLGYHRVGDVHQWIQEVFNHQILETKAIWGLFNHCRGRRRMTTNLFSVIPLLLIILITQDFLLNILDLTRSFIMLELGHHPTIPQLSPTSSWGCFHPAVGFIQSLPLKLKHWIKHWWVFGSRYLLVSLPPAGAGLFFVDTKDTPQHTHTHSEKEIPFSAHTLSFPTVRQLLMHQGTMNNWWYLLVWPVPDDFSLGHAEQVLFVYLNGKMKQEHIKGVSATDC